MEWTDFFAERTDYFMERSAIDWHGLTWNDLTMERNDRLPSYTYQTTDEQIKIFVTENTESDTFCKEEYSGKYTIVVWNSLLR